ncbi:MAG: methyltransferase [Anaerolineae bacterium]|nr:methyltransferase [Anaerolineae bacterium]
MQESHALEQITANVLASPKYRRVCADTVRRIAAQALARQETLAQAIKSTKSKLHQVYGAYGSTINYRRALDDLSTSYTMSSSSTMADRSAFKLTCHKLLSLHASTRERLHILDHFFERIFACTGTPAVLLDLACGLGPLALPWMNLAPDAVYNAYDIDAQRIEFLNHFFDLAGVRGRAHLHDILCRSPEEQADVALLLKSSACLEQQEKGSTLTLLDCLHAPHIVVTYPVASLGRRPKGMVAHYAQTFEAMLADRPWSVTRLDFETELAFVVSK